MSNTEGCKDLGQTGSYLLLCQGSKDPMVQQVNICITYSEVVCDLAV